MNAQKKRLLQQHMNDVVTDLDVVYIIDELYTNEALSNEDYDAIFSLPNRVDRTRYLIETLIHKGTDRTYEAFVDSLFKDHEWLWKKFSIEMKPDTTDSFEDSLSRGDVPRLPDHYVQRTKLEQEVSAKLKQLSRHKILALHGITGSGKTSVAIAALRNNPELINENFNGVVFWLNLGNIKTDDDVVDVQMKLHRKASMYLHKDSAVSFINSSISMSSIGSNADSHSLTSYDRSCQELRDMLKSLFSELVIKEALLVLDEVNEKKCVEAFDIGCKLLVTIRDTDVVSNFQPQIVKIENSFKDQEALQYFASCLDVEVSALPRQAKKLIDICKGSPFQITLIGAQLAENKEKLIHDKSCWNSYIRKLEKKDYIFYTRYSDNPMKTIEVCIKSLSPDILPLFKLLAILPDNAKVSSVVLSKLWHKDQIIVDKIMKQLRSKSLINEYYNPELRHYIYEVHDIIMNYLRTCYTENEMAKLHSDFLDSYNFVDVNSKLELVDDGYFAFYLGHHIHRTNNYNNKWSLFKLYLDLKFLGQKVRLTGPADAIMDFEKYENQIIQDEMDRELLHHIKSFLSTHGNDLYRYPHTDIVQSILQYETKGTLYSKACKIAQERCQQDELYFELLHEQNIEEIKHSTIDVKESITSVCFLGDYVLVGTVNGVVKIYHVATSTLNKELPNAGAPIKWVANCPSNALFVAALTEQGVVKIWYIDDVEQENNDNAIEEESEDINYNESFAPTTINPKLGPFINCRWANNDEILITHTAKKIITYTTTGAVVQMIDLFDRDKRIINCVPMNDDKNLLVASCVNDVHYIDLLNARTKENVMSLDKTVPIENVLCVPCSNRILVLNENEVLEYDFKFQTYPQTSYSMYTSNKIISSCDIKDNLKFISAIVNKTGTLLFISTNDSRVICVCLKTNTYIFDLDNRRGNVLSMAVSEVYDDFVPSSDVLLTGTDTTEDSVKVWYLDASFVTHATQQHRKVRLTTKFDVSFLHTLSPQTPSGRATPPQDQNSVTPKRHKSFVNPRDIEKKPATKTRSLDRHSLKPLNLKGLCNGNDEAVLKPLLAVVDDKNNIQIIRGHKILTEIASKSEDKITTLRISPCNQYVIYGTQSGTVMKYTLRSKEIRVIMDIYGAVQYLNFVTPTLLVVAGTNRCLMTYRYASHGDWKLDMLQKGNVNLGSQEILNGAKKKMQADNISQAGSEGSTASKSRHFPSNDIKNRLCDTSYLVECFYVDNLGLITVENNATIKLWVDEVKQVLSGRQTDVYVNCAAFQKNVLVICDDYGKFQVYKLRIDEEISLRLTHENKVNHRILSCDVTTDGHILAMGLDSGDVVTWNIPGRCLLHTLKHHKSRVQTCFFSPVPEGIYRSNSAVQSPVVGLQFNFNQAKSTKENQPPLVLVTMASEIVWWDIKRVIKTWTQKRNSWSKKINVLSPVISPRDPRNDLAESLDEMTIVKPKNFFFGSGSFNAHECWESTWKNKTYKEGSKNKDILACIKLSGMNAKRLCRNDEFSCFVTVDNPGHIHVMNIMRPHS